MRWIGIIGLVLMAACVSTTSPPPQQAAPKSASVPTRADIARFKAVVARVEPVAERACRQSGGNRNCDFKIIVVEQRGKPPNAFQTQDKSGRPILAFNHALLAEVRNDDELAFVMGHEAAHHIRGHLAKKNQNAMIGAILLGGIAAATGADASQIDQAVNMGAGVGGLTYSKEFELEADGVGTVITKRAGYNPVRGAQFFTQTRDPGDQILGTHPPHAARIQKVKEVNAGL